MRPAFFLFQVSNADIGIDNIGRLTFVRLPPRLSLSQRILHALRNITDYFYACRIRWERDSLGRRRTKVRFPILSIPISALLT